MAKRSYYAAGGQDQDENRVAWAPRIDKDPFHRTMDIFNGVFKKNVKLSGGKNNCTDLHTIYLDFGELKPSRLASELREGADSEHTVWMLECGHEWEGKKINKEGFPKVIGRDYGMCGICGADQIYRAFEHEWQHIIFKSDLAARQIFCELYADQLSRQAPGVDKKELTKFLGLLTNAFDDIRCNSLWEKVYPGSAAAIWDRWRYYTNKMGDKVNTSFLAYIFAVAFNLPTDPQGEFEPMRPVIEWAVNKVKYRGFANMLVDVRVVIDRCMGALLAKMQPPPAPPKLQPPPPPSLDIPPSTPSPGDGNEQDKGDNDGSTDGEGQEQGDTNGQDDFEQEGSQGEGQSEPSEESEDDTQQSQGGGQESRPNGQEQSEDNGKQTQHGSQQGGDDEEGEGSNGGGSGLGGVPSSKDVPATEQEKAAALEKLMQDTQDVCIDPKEEHSPPTDDDLDQATASQATRAMMAKVLHQDISDVDQLQATPDGEPDADMQAQIDQLQSGVAQKSESSQLTGNAKAKVTVIEVTRAGKGDRTIELEASERAAIQRMRTVFFKTMGKQKAKRSVTGNAVDVESLIQYLADHQDPNIFENEDINQGFAYSVLCDMSGSMQGTFPTVCRAVEMLKQALHFPFVVGNLWGFRGGESLIKTQKSSFFGNGEVWMYRYAKDVDWYTGTTPHRLFPGPSGVVEAPVKCGGITPMNSAINVAAGHLWRKMPAGMAKRMFLLTDGSPIQVKVTGRQISDFILRQFVAKEIHDARKHGIQVYTIVIGDNAIDDEKCLQMFGNRKFWVKTDRENVGNALAGLVLRNFSRYLKS